jgi:hypothetical protein
MKISDTVQLDLNQAMFNLKGEPYYVSAVTQLNAELELTT